MYESFDFGSKNFVEKTFLKDKYKDVIEIQEALGSQMQGLVTPSRELIKKGRLIKISRRATGFQDRHVFLVKICA